MVDEACLAEFGEAFDLIPMIQPPNGRVVSDTTRVAQTAISGLFRAPGARGAFSKSREGFETARSPGIQGAKPGVAIRREGLTWAPRKSDRVRRVKTGKLYEVVLVEDFALNSLDLILAETAA